MKQNSLMVLLAMVLACAARLYAATPAQRPNVIVVLTDDQGYGDLSCNGNPVLQTPNMDQLQREGVRFTQFHVDSYCSPTRAALMTGRDAHRVGVWGTVCGRNRLREGELTMAEVFRANGYRTGHFGKWHLGGNYPYRSMDRGFDECLGHGDGGTGTTTDFWGNDRVNDHCLHNGKWEPTAGFECNVLFDAAMRFIRTLPDKQQPFFIYLATYNPHEPCSLPDVQEAKVFEGKVPVATAYFYGSIVRVDDNLGRLRRFLKEQNLDEDTLLLFLSDNGTSAGEKVFNAGMRGKEGSPYDGGHRVPCFLRWPAGGFAKPIAVDHLARHLDLLPTLIDLCSLKLPKPIAFDGVSLKPLLTDPKADWPDRTLVQGTPPNQVEPLPGTPPYGKKCSVMTDRWRLVNLVELYDMTVDPGQQTNVANQYPQVVRQLRESYDHYWTSVSVQDENWRGRPVIGSSAVPETDLCAETWYPTEGRCPWNQGYIARGAAAFGRWSVRIARAGHYQIELRRWPREADTPMNDIPPKPTTVDAYRDDRPVDGTLFPSHFKPLPVAKAQLKAGDKVLEADVAAGDKVKTFDLELDAGDIDIEATLLDQNGKPLCGAYYVCVRSRDQSAQP